MTPDQIASRLGLSHPRKYAQESTWKQLDKVTKGRRTIVEATHRNQGHSTRNILAALSRLYETEAEKVLIIAHNKDMMVAFVKQARDWAFQLGLDPRRINGSTSARGAHLGLNPQQVFVDHVVHEIATEN